MDIERGLLQANVFSRQSTRTAEDGNIHLDGCYDFSYITTTALFHYNGTLVLGPHNTKSREDYKLYGVKTYQDKKVLLISNFAKKIGTTPFYPPK